MIKHLLSWVKTQALEGLIHLGSISGVSRRIKSIMGRCEIVIDSLVSDKAKIASLQGARDLATDEAIKCKLI